MNFTLRFLFGTKKYRIQCSSPSRICGKLMAQYTDAVFSVKVIDKNTFEFVCTLQSSKKITAFLEDYGCEVFSVTKRGVPFWLRNIIKRPGLIIGIFFIFVSVLYGNGIVWDMEISGNESICDEDIENNLAMSGFAVGKRYDRDRLSSVCNKFILQDDRFARIAINMSGNKAFVEVTERTKKNNTEILPSYSGIIASCDCIIERPEVISGTSLVKNGDTVLKGTMLISPVESGSDGKEYISGAKGRVYARTEEVFAVSVPYEYIEVKDNEVFTKDYVFSFLGAEFKVSSPWKKMDSEFVCNTTKDKIIIFEDTVLPFKITKTEKRTYSVASKKRTPKEAEQKAYDMIYSQIASFSDDSEILSTEFELVENDDSLVLYCYAECLRNVAQIK